MRTYERNNYYNYTLPCSPHFTVLVVLLSDFTHPYKINFHLLWFPYVNRYRAQWDNAPRRRETTQWVIKYSNYILQKKNMYIVVSTEHLRL